MLIHLLTFVSGAAVEGVAVFWVHFSERGYALRTGVCSMIQAAALVFGIGETVHDGRYAPAFILGYGAGSALAVWLKRARSSKTTSSPTPPNVP